MASDKEGDRSLSGGSKGGSQGSGTSTGWGGSSSGSSKGGSQGSGTSSSWGGKSTGGGSKSSKSGGTPGSSPGGGWSAAAGGSGGGTKSVTSTTGAAGYTGGGPTGGSSPARGLGTAIGAAAGRGLAAAPVTTATALRAATTPTGFRSDLGLRPDLNPAVRANAALQSALAMTRAKEHLPGTDPYDPALYSTVFGSGVVPGLTEMTPRQVMEFQKTMPRSRAVGAYQIKDIPWAAKLAGIDLDKDKFSISTQDRMAAALAARRIGLATDKKTGAIDTQKAAVQIANEWTSYALPATGKSAVPKNNKARGGPGDTLTAVQNFVTAFAPETAPTTTSAATALERLAAPIGVAPSDMDLAQAARAEEITSMALLGRMQTQDEVDAYIRSWQRDPNDPHLADAKASLLRDHGITQENPPARSFTLGGATPAAPTAPTAPAISGLRTASIDPNLMGGAVQSGLVGPIPRDSMPYMADTRALFQRGPGVETMFPATGTRPTGTVAPTAASFADKYLGTGRPVGVAPASPVSANLAPTPAATSAGAQAVLNDLAARDAAEFGVGAGMSGVTPRSAGITYAGTTPPSQALAPGPVGAGFASAISPQAQAAGFATPFGGRPNVPVGSLPAAQPAGRPAPDLTTRTRMGDNEDIARAMSGVGPPASTPTNDFMAQTLANAPRSNVGVPPAASLTNRTVAQGMATAIANPTMEVPPARPEQMFDPVAGRITLDEQPLSIERFKQQTPEIQQILSSYGKLNPVGTVALNSLNRSPEHNKAVKGAKHSQHLQNNAFDISLKGMTDEQKAQTVVNLRAAGAVRIGAYPGQTALHVDALNAAPDEGLDVKTMYNYRYKDAVKKTSTQDWLARVPDWFAKGLTTPIDRAAVSLALGGPGDEGGAAGNAVTVANAGGYPPAPPGPGDAGPVAGNTPDTGTSAATTRPAGTGPATGPWGDDKLEPVTGPKAPEPLTTGQKWASLGVKTGLGIFGGLAGAAITGIDLLDEMATGQGFIDALIARSDNPRTGGGSGSYRSLTGETASASGRDRAGTPTTPTTPTPKPPETKPIATVNNVVEKYIEDTTKRPTPAQRWNYEDDTYSEYA